MRVLNPTQPNHHRSTGRVRRLRTIAVLPTLLTLANLVCGFAAIYLAILGTIDAFTDVLPSAKATLNSRVIEDLLPTYCSVAGFLIFVGMFCDMMDGRVARLTSGTSSFGGQLDSLADCVTFGMAPALLVVMMIVIASEAPATHLYVSTRFAWVAGVAFTSCTALRLARFNVEHAKTDLRHRSFHGLPTPGAAAVVASLVICYEHVPEVRGILLLNALPFALLLTAVLMVSRVRYVHVGNAYLRGRRPFGHVLGIVAVVAGLVWAPAPTLAVTACLYALSGPVGMLFVRSQPRPTESPADVKPAGDSAATERRA